MADIRLCTGLIIMKDSEFLVGRIIGTDGLKWSKSPWEAWRTRIRANARSVQSKIGGDIMLFNPIAGKIRKAVL